VTLQDLGNLGEILGALAVVVSLFYVGSQIRQNTAAVRSPTAQAVRDNYAAWYSHLAADGELVRILIQGLKDLVSSPGGKQFWAERADAFGDEFRSHVVNVIMKRTPAPEARPLGVFKLE
jgi:hypothetical protein